MYAKLMNIFSNVLSTHDPTQLVLTSAIAFLAVLWFYLLFLKKSSTTTTNPLLPPGPKGLPLLGNLVSLDPELHTYFAALAKTYGPIYTLRLGQKIGLVITSPTLAKEVLKDHDAVFANRNVPMAGKEATYGGADIVWNPYGPKWRMLRKVCVREMLGPATLDSVYALRRREIRRTVGYLYSRAGMTLNVREQVMNVITSMMWGGTEEALGPEFKEVVGEMTALLGIPNLSDFYPSLARFDLQGVRKKMKVLAKRFDGIFESIIDRRLKSIEDGKEEETKDFLGFLLQLIDTQGDGKTPFTMTHLKS